MTMKRIDITAATQPQLLVFARDTLGFNSPPNILAETLRAKIAAAWPKDYIMVSEADETPAQDGSKPQPQTAEQAGPAEGMRRIHINITEEAGGTEAVPVGVNGRIMLVPRGKNVDIPEAYYLVLKAAIKNLYDPIPDGGMNPVPREVPMYPFQLVA